MGFLLLPFWVCYMYYLPKFSILNGEFCKLFFASRVCVQALFRTFEAKSIPYFKIQTKT